MRTHILRIPLLAAGILLLLIVMSSCRTRKHRCNDCPTFSRHHTETTIFSYHPDRIYEKI